MANNRLVVIIIKKENVAFLAVLALAIAASVNFPVRFLSMYWRKPTTRGAFIGGFIGLSTAVILIILSPTIWVKILGNESAISPYSYPTLFSVIACFTSIWFFSVTDKSAQAQAERDAFQSQLIRSQLGNVN